MVDDILFSENKAAEEVLALATIKQFAINELTASQQGVQVNQVDITDLVSHLTLDKEKQLVNLVQLSNANTSDTEVEQATKEQEQTPIAEAEPESQPQPNNNDFVIQLAKLQLATPGYVHINDQSVEPNFCPRY